MLYRMTTGAPIFGLRREIDRLFEDTFAREGGGSFTPAVDIKENDTEIRLELELPGLKADQVEITAENGVLTVRGDKRSERKEGEDNRYQVVERSYGTFVRTFQLPQGVDEDQIKAEFENGILTLSIPKAALPQPKRIQISGSETKERAAVGVGSVSSQHSTGRTSGQRPSTTSQREKENEKMAAQTR